MTNIKIKNLWDIDRGTRKGPPKTNQQENSHLEGRPDLKQNDI